MDALLHRLLGLEAASLDTLEAWWAATRDVRERETTTADRALVGGVLADRMGFAFAAGYQEALRALVKSDGISALCVTEARGNSPKDIDTTLTADGDGFAITGRKKWSTAAPLASSLLVCAKVGVDEQGRNMLRLVRVPTNATGVTLVPSTAPFVPEIPHAEVVLDSVRVAASAVLPGDGYVEYVKPFRTVEDAHVHAALLGYVIGIARRNTMQRDVIEQLLATALSFRAIALSDPRSPHVHIALAGAMAQAAQLIAEVERAWSELDAPGDEHVRWQRDRSLLRVAGAARAARREAAWTRLGAN
jgi:acyl-CoA dehydrogenase